MLDLGHLTIASRRLGFQIENYKNAGRRPPFRGRMNAVRFQPTINYIFFWLHLVIDGKNKILLLQYYYHIVWIPKYRRKVLVGAVKTDLETAHP